MKYFTIIFTFILSLSLNAQSTFPEYGKASFYADNLVGKITASGEKYKHNELTAAHKSLPFGSKIRVTNLTNGKSVTVRINDRGPYKKDRIIDLSKRAAEKLDFVETGITDVKIELINSNETTTDTPKKKSTVKDIFKYYEVSAKICEPGSYGIQIASYSDSGSILKTISDFKSKYDLPIFVQESLDNNGKKYRLIVGKFDSRKEAESQIVNIQTDYNDCFILNLDK